MKYFDDFNGERHAWIILDPKKSGPAAVVGKVISNRGKNGFVRAWLWDWPGDQPPSVQHGTAGGGGYSKLDAIMSHFTFAGKPLSESGWQKSIKSAGLEVLSIC